MSAILNSLNAHNFFIFQPILMTHVSKCMVYRALSDKTYLLLRLRSPTQIKALQIKTNQLSKQPFQPRTQGYSPRPYYNNKNNKKKQFDKKSNQGQNAQTQGHINQQNQTEQETVAKTVDRNETEQDEPLNE